MNELQRMRRETYFAVGVLGMALVAGLFALVLWAAKRPRWRWRLPFGGLETSLDVTNYMAREFKNRGWRN